MSTSIGFDVVAHDHASRTLGTIGRSVDGSSTKWKRLGSVVRTVGKATAAGLLVAVTAGAGFAKGAAEDEQAARQMAIAMHNNAGATKAQTAAVEDWITKVGISKGVADDELRPALTRLVTATHDVSKAQQLAALGMNIAAGTGKSLETVTTALAKAQNGSVGGLSRLGVATKDAAGKTLTFDQLQQNLAKTFRGQASSAANTTAGQYARLKVMLTETGESIGYKLLPYAMKIGQWMLNTGIPAAQRLGSWLRDHLTPAISGVSGWFKRVGDNGDTLGSVMDDLSVFVDDSKRAWSALAPFLKTAANDYVPVLKAQIKGTANNLRLMGEAGIWMWNNALAPVLKMGLAQFAVFSRVIGNSLQILGKAPGMGWVGKLGDKLVDASNKAADLGSKIRDIPSSHDVTIRVTTIRTSSGKDIPIPGTAGMGVMAGAGGKGGSGGNLTAATQSLLNQLVTGIDKTKKGASKVLDAVRDDYQTKADALRQVMQDSRDFGNSFKDWATSIFSQTSSEDAPLTLTSLMSSQHSEEGTSAQVLADTNSVLAKGLSRDLLSQLQQQGAQGIETLHLLAQASNAQIDEFNRSNKATMDNYATAGMAAADKVYAGDVAQAESDKATAAALLDVVQSFKNLENVEFVIRGNDLVAIIKKHKKNKGEKDS